MDRQINGYQTKNDLFCVTATYNLDSHSSVPFFSGTVRSVYNYANQGHVNGPAEGSVNGTILCARVPDDKRCAHTRLALLYVMCCAHGGIKPFQLYDITTCDFFVVADTQSGAIVGGAVLLAQPVCGPLLDFGGGPSP